MLGSDPVQPSHSGPGRNLLWEVDPHLHACANPPPPATRCLRVRERKLSPHSPFEVSAQPIGEWQLLETPIEAYEHTEGERILMQLKRYDVRDSATGRPRTDYVFHTSTPATWFQFEENKR